MGWESLIIQVLYIIIGTFVSIVGYWARKQLASNVKVNELLLKEAWVKAGVEFAEQTYGALDGPQQYQHALEWITNRFKASGFAINPHEIQGLIEKTVYEMKQGWLEYEEDMFHG